MGWERGEGSVKDPCNAADGLPVILPLLKADWVQTPALEILKCAPQPNFCRALLLARRGHVVRGGG